jgi:hypothetical protein
MIRLLVFLAIAGVLAFCGATVPLGKRTFFGHVRAIWSSNEMGSLKDGVKETAGPAADKVKRGIKAGVEAAKDDGSGSGSGSAKQPEKRE